MKKQEKMKIHNLRNTDRIFNLQESKSQKQIYGIPSDSMELRPWDEKKFARLTARINYKKMPNDFVTKTIRSETKKFHNKSKRATQTYLTREKQFKPKTAPNHSSFQIKQKKHILTQQMNRIKPIDDLDFQNQFFKQDENTNYYPKFRCSINQRNKFLFLKPYIKSTTRYNRQLNPCTYEGMEKLKNFLYKSIKNSEEKAQKERSKQIENEKKSQNGDNEKLNSNRSVYQYLTDIKQYGQQENQKNNHTQINYYQSSRSRLPHQENKKTGSLSVLKQKLKNKYKESKYTDKLMKIKSGEGVPITIIH